jgi:tRNA modification GTPase
LREIIYKNLMGSTGKRQPVLITNIRHKDALERSRDDILRALDNLINSEPLEFTAFELNDALYNLGLITGESCSDDILNTIFERFCIGK